MSEKVKLLKKDFSFLKKDMEMEKEELDKLAKMQAEREKKLQIKAEDMETQAVESYNARINMLKEAKAAAAKEYDEEIKKLENLVKGFKKKKKDKK